MELFSIRIQRTFQLVSTGMQGFSEKYYPKGWRFFQKTGGLTLLSRTIPELPLHPARK